ASTLAHLSRLRSDWWLRAWAGLHLAGVHSGEMVSRPAGNGYRAGDHGIWRRSLYWLESQPSVDGSIQITNQHWSCGKLCGDGRNLLLLHDVRLSHRSDSR